MKLASRGPWTASDHLVPWQAQAPYRRARVRNARPSPRSAPMPPRGMARSRDVRRNGCRASAPPKNRFTGPRWGFEPVYAKRLANGPERANPWFHSYSLSAPTESDMTRLHHEDTRRSSAKTRPSPTVSSNSTPTGSPPFCARTDASAETGSSCSPRVLPVRRRASRSPIAALVVDELPLDSRGKVDRTRARNPLEGRATTPLEEPIHT